MIALLACSREQLSFQRVYQVPKTELPAAGPPPAKHPSGEKLYQLLYAGETGVAARQMGQRARMLVWFRVMELSDDQLRGLRKLVENTRVQVAADTAAVDAVGEKERAALGPVYQEIITTYGKPEADPTEAELAALAAKLEAAVNAVTAEGDPRQEQILRVRALLNDVQPWIDTLSQAQQEKLGLSRFLLAHRTHPYLTPAGYSALVGMEWDGGDFRTIDDTVRSEDERQMDLGGLWSTEAMRSAPGRYLTTRQLRAMVLMATLEPGLIEAIEVALGQRAPDDYTSAPTGAATADAG
ncbi:MAG: hypothetical protein ACOZNI_26025 [Myxococcota bacterium]